MHSLLVAALLAVCQSAALCAVNPMRQLAAHFVEVSPLGSGLDSRRLVSSRSVGGNNPDAPKLIPLSALDRYQEGADLRLFCSASAPISAGRLHFEWRKNHNELLASSASGADDPINSVMQSNNNINNNKMQGKLKPPPPPPPPQQQQRRIQVASMDDDSASMLRISQLEAQDSGNYTCLVRNQQGFDSSTVRVLVNVKLKWTIEPPDELQVKAGKFVQLECEASGQPAPMVSWTSLKDRQTINSKVLRIDRVTTNHSGLYECRAISGYQSSSSFEAPASGTGEQLRKLVRLVVNGKY